MSIVALIPVVAALAGVLVGGLIAELRIVLETRRERRKALNRLLWCQLDLWYDLERSDIRPVVDLMLSRLAAKLGIKEEDLGIPDVQREIMGGIVGEIAKDARHPESEARYHEAVEALAFFDPVLAYRLSGKTSLTKHREQGDTYFDAALKQFGPSEVTENDAQVEAMMRPWLQRELYDSARRTLREDIEMVARALNRRTRRRVRHLFVSLKQRIEKDQQEIVDASIDRLIEQFKIVAGRLQSAAVSPVSLEESA